MPRRKWKRSYDGDGNHGLVGKGSVVGDQIVLFAPTLDASISNYHPVRMLDELLRGQDWSAWMAEVFGNSPCRKKHTSPRTFSVFLCLRPEAWEDGVSGCNSASPQVARCAPHDNPLEIPLTLSMTSITISVRTNEAHGAFCWLLMPNCPPLP